jgi:hypothetical protein
MKTDFDNLENGSTTHFFFFAATDTLVKGCLLLYVGALYCIYAMDYSVVCLPKVLLLLAMIAFKKRVCLTNKL